MVPETPLRKSQETPKKSASPLQKNAEEQKTLAEERLNQLKYLQADFDNYRKHFEKEKQAIINLANENLINDLLPFFDDLEKAASHAQDEHKHGLELLYKKLLTLMGKHGVKPIETVGKLFDPHQHEVLQKEPSDKQENIILEEFQKGYLLKTKVIRPAKVKIATKKS